MEKIEILFCMLWITVIALLWTIIWAIVVVRKINKKAKMLEIQYNSIQKFILKHNPDFYKP